MTIARVLAVAATFASLVLAFASPARADQVMQGVYTYTQGDLVATWTIYPTCVPTVGEWVYSKNLLDGFKCADGSTAAQQETYKFDDATMSGTRSVIHNDVCGVPAAIANYPFTLAYQGPLPMPVDRYPLYCEPGGLKRCF